MPVPVPVPVSGLEEPPPQAASKVEVRSNASGVFMSFLQSMSAESPASTDYMKYFFAETIEIYPGGRDAGLSWTAAACGSITLNTTWGAS